LALIGTKISGSIVVFKLFSSVILVIEFLGSFFKTPVILKGCFLLLLFSKTIVLPTTFVLPKRVSAMFLVITTE